METFDMNYPRDLGSPVSPVPFGSEGPRPFYPPVCLKTHWDPTAILKHTLPTGYVPQALDPRPWTRICMEYTTAGEQEAAPTVGSGTTLPSGGQFYPNSRYAAAIDNESRLRALDRPLGTCEKEQFAPNINGDMFNSRILVPDNSVPNDPKRIHEIAFPRVLLRAGPYDCREQNDRLNMSLASDYVFNNATKQDRYKLMKKPTKPSPPSQPVAS